MTDYEKNKIKDLIYGMTDEEREVVIYALQEIYENEQEQYYIIVAALYSQYL